MPPASTARPSPEALRAVEAGERRLRDAALAGDVAALDALLAEDLVFIDRAGQILGKQQDLDLHRSGALRLTRLEFSDYRFHELAEGVMLVWLRADAEGRSAGQPFVAALRFTRVWTRKGASWRIASMHASAIG
ncbi:nuclear transport factor 2 family protein [Ancylobacter radicis]|uniref:Nuclear transport factor 2 family protein n=1 Tax=Ancylobacter radicis TaxID=2836179 RepID=A0ABS5RAA8_9HYPH|nr:nuclear transport factor 2 family protein [Ancylobacter radicis]MBS9478220.1 nuclear transport factor 2 family protein [Ancylobacter radicis]